jgi:hypothetical protein
MERTVKRSIVLAMLCLSLSGVSSCAVFSLPGRVRASRAVPTEEERAAADAATRYLAANDALPGDYTTSVARNANGWSVHVFRRPRVSDGEVIVNVDRDGKATGVHRPFEPAIDDPQ